MKNRSKAIIVTLFLLFGIFLVPAKTTFAADGNVYASVEKFTLGQGYLIKPTTISFKEGETYADVIQHLLQRYGYTYKAISTSTRFYLSAIDNADSGVLNVPKCIQNMPGDDIPRNKITRGNKYKNNGLGEFSYSQYSGWYYFINNVPAKVGMSGMKPKNGDVVRFQFTLYGLGADLGDTSGEQNNGVKALKLPNRDSITKKLAIMSQNSSYKKNASWVKAYNQAVAVAENLDATQSQIQTVESNLPSAMQISNWIKAQEQTKQNQKPVGADQGKKDQEKKKENQKETQKKVQKKQELIRKNTPVAAVLKKVKKVSGNKAQLTWKKISNATGYEIYRSVKKNSGYKKIKTIKRMKTTTYKTGKLKKKKVYYFKVRAYRKVGGVTYFGKYSGVKKIKIK